MFDSMDSDLNDIFLRIWRDILLDSACKLQCLSHDVDSSTKLGMVAFTCQIVHHLAMVVMLLSAVPARDHLPIQEELEEVGGARRVRSIDAVLEPDLAARVDGYVARCDCSR